MNKLQPLPDLSATRWTLSELFVVFSFAGVASFLASVGAVSLGVCFFATVVSFRIATVDFSLPGSVASGLVLLFGIPTLFLTLWWAVNG